MTGITLRINSDPFTGARPARGGALDISPRRTSSTSASAFSGGSPAAGLHDVGNAVDGMLARLATRASISLARGQVDLDTLSSQHPSTLTSTAQLNAAASSYDEVALSFGTSTTVATLSGVYSGSGTAASAKSLKLEFTADANLTTTASPLQFRIRDQNNTTLFTYSGSAKAGDVISLGADIGLSVSFAAGTAVSGGSSETAVGNATPTTVNPNAVFNDPDVNARPRFDSGTQVQAGHFFVDGVQVEVKADDSIRSVLQRINDTVPGIHATIDHDKVTLSTTSNTRREIVIANDTSGFFAATNLTDAETVRGHVRGDQEILAQSSAFGAVTSGSFRVNGQEVSVDPTSDTLASVLARVKAADPSVSARYDSAGKTVDIWGPGLVLDGDSSGFLAAAGIQSGVQAPATDPTEFLSLTAAAALQQTTSREFEDLLKAAPLESPAAGKSALAAPSELPPTGKKLGAAPSGSPPAAKKTLAPPPSGRVQAAYKRASLVAGPPKPGLTPKISSSAR